MDPLENMTGMQDGLQRLWTPHRLVYIEGLQGPKTDICVFCEAPEKSDEDGLIVYRGKLAYVLLNLFPYNAGHLLVCPYRHFSTYDLASKEETAEVALLTQQAMATIVKTSGAHGFNIGMNQGEVAGAGIAEHLHQHLVPRWRNDSNFFPIIGQTKAMPKLLGEVRETFANSWVTDA
ncbi:MAG: HIT domain-containing protein [Aquiluna sp.]